MGVFERSEEPRRIHSSETAVEWLKRMRRMATSEELNYLTQAVREMETRLAEERLSPSMAAGVRRTLALARTRLENIETGHATERKRPSKS
jgi:ABC-type transport system involved in cytochrome c biogenesis ATPase subunit